MCCRELGFLCKVDSNGCTGPGAKVMDSKLPHSFLAAGVPTNADECLEADQSRLTGPVLFFIEVSGRGSTVSFEACSNDLCIPRGQYNS